MTDFEGVLKAWDDDARTGGKRIHPLDPDSPEFWELGKQQAQQVRQYARSGSRVVDFGAGIGRLTIPLIKMGYQVTAVDASTHMLDALEQRAGAAGVSPKALNLVHSHGPGLADIIGEGNTDVVVARAVLIHHDYEGVEAIVTALAAVLADGGHLIADWHTGEPGERRDWVDVTRWHPHHRSAVARLAGLEEVAVDASASAPVWRRRERPGQEF